MPLNDLIRWRNEAVLSFDAYSIKRFMKHWGIPIPRMVYTAVLRMPDTPRTARIRAEYELRKLEEGGV